MPATSQSESREPTHFAFVDSLRGWAILLVILTHAAQGPLAVAALSQSSSGTIPQLALPPWLAAIAGNAGAGVQLFFVVSAFSLTLSWLSRGASTGATKRFLARRVFRIAPMYYLAIAIYLLIYGMGPRFAAPHGITPNDILLTATFLSVWKLNALNSVVPGDWSVGCEATFYLLLPLLLIRLRKPRVMIGVTIVLAALTQLRMRYLIVHGLWSPLSYFQFQNQLVVFCFGVIAALLLHEPAMARWLGARRPGMVLRALPLLLFAGIVVGVALVGIPVWWIGAQMQNGILAAGLCVALFYAPSTLLVNPVMQQIGLVSFSMYLLHFCFFGMAMRLAHALQGTAGLHGTGPAFLAIYYPILVGISFAAAWTTYHLIERPCIRLGRTVIAARLNATSPSARPGATGSAPAIPPPPASSRAAPAGASRRANDT